MEPQQVTVPDPWAAASAEEIAAAAGAEDLLVFRRVAEGGFAHLGGAGRGAGWAGIVEVGVDDDEPLLEAILGGETIFRRAEREPWHVVGPYYSRSVAAVPVSADVFVVFGAATDVFSSLSDPELLALARHAGETLYEVSPAKRLGDELEVMHAVRDLLQSPAEAYDEALLWLVERATVSLSCDLGLAYVDGGARIQIADHRGGSPLDTNSVAGALAEIGQWREFPLCVQQAAAVELPRPSGRRTASSPTTSSRSSSRCPASCSCSTRPREHRGASRSSASRSGTSSSKQLSPCSRPLSGAKR